MGRSVLRVPLDYKWQGESMYYLMKHKQGEGYQMWNDTSEEGEPISPVLDTPEKLAQWLADNKAYTFANLTGTYEQWLAMIKQGTCCSCMVEVGKRLISGVEAVYEESRVIANCVHCGAPILQGEKTHKNADGISKELMCQGCYDELRRD